MIDVQFKYADFDRAARSMGQAVDQVPFALSQSLNRAATAARKEVVDVAWPAGKTIRNRGFMGWLMRTEFSTKANLRVKVYNREPRAFVPLHAEGGSKRPTRGGLLAIPGTIVKRARGSHGVPANLKPRNLRGAFRKGNAIFQRDGRNRLQLMYVLKGSAQIRKDFAAHETFEAVMRSEVSRQFPIAMQAAMKTRR